MFFEHHQAIYHCKCLDGSNLPTFSIYWWYHTWYQHRPKISWKLLFCVSILDRSRGLQYWIYKEISLIRMPPKYRRSHHPCRYLVNRGFVTKYIIEKRNLKRHQPQYVVWETILKYKIANVRFSTECNLWLIQPELKFWTDRWNMQ